MNMLKVSKEYTKFDVITTLIKRQKYKCAAPFCSADLREGCHVDHIFPKSRGGQDTLSNYQLLCPACNSAKHTKSMEEWVEYLKMKGTVPLTEEETRVLNAFMRGVRPTIPYIRQPKKRKKSAVRQAELDNERFGVRDSRKKASKLAPSQGRNLRILQKLNVYRQNSN